MRAPWLLHRSAEDDRWRVRLRARPDCDDVLAGGREHDSRLQPRGVLRRQCERCPAVVVRSHLVAVADRLALDAAIAVDPRDLAGVTGNAIAGPDQRLLELHGQRIAAVLHRLDATAGAARLQRALEIAGAERL